MHRGIRSSGMRTPRTHAEDKGTASAGFDAVINPEETWRDEYKSPADAAKPPAGSAIRQPDPQPVPFALK